MINPAISTPSASSPKGLCTRCGHLAQFKLEQSHNLHGKSNDGDYTYENASVLRCMGCGSAVISLSIDSVGTSHDLKHGEVFFYYPPMGAGTLDPAVPKKIYSLFDEGHRCLSVGAIRAAVVMFRGALAEFVQDKGSENAQGQKGLFRRLELMSEEGSLHPSLVDWARSIRVLGNEGAHPEKYDPVTRAEAHSIAALARELIKVEYEVPAQVERARAGE